MPDLPAHVALDIQGHLGAIAAHFILPRITLVVRPNVLAGADAEVIITNDDPLEAVKAIVRRHETGVDR